jgi:hypothetical protein
MLKLFLGVFIALLLSFGCSDSTPNSSETSNGKTTRNTPEPSAEVAETTPVATSDVLEVEAVAGTEVDAPDPDTKVTVEHTPKSEPVVKDKARPRSESTPSNPAPQPTAPSTKNTTTTNKAGKTIGTKPGVPELNHDKLDALLRKHVNSSGKVDYKTFKKDQPVLEDYINILELNPPQSSWSKNKEMAYWINLYNAFTIYAILEKWPVSSITDLEGGKVWDRKTITIGGERLTLNDIEKNKLLKRFKDPRIHFAVNCAAASCPPLLNKAWTEENIQRYLQKQTKSFINDSNENQLSATSIQVSQIFNWYADDFGGKDKIVAYVQKYADIDIKDNAQLVFNEYDWGLNN